MVSLPRHKISPSDEEDWQSSRLHISPNKLANGEAQPHHLKMQEDQFPPDVVEELSSELSDSFQTTDLLVPIFDNSSRSTPANFDRSIQSLHSSFSRNNSTAGRQVAFDSQVKILEFNTIIGDNPGVSGGCPIALGHELSQTRIVSLRELDYIHSKRKGGDAPKLSLSQRAKM